MNTIQQAASQPKSAGQNAPQKPVPSQAPREPVKYSDWASI
ncbi:MAG: hypothetical protein ACRBBK_02025 [Paracoccaceae bacterium]